MGARKWLVGLAMVAVVLVLASDYLMAQNQQGQQQGGRRRFDPAAMRQRMMDRIKEQLGASDDDWAVMQPLVEKVQTLQREAEGRMGMRGMFGRGGRGGRGRRGNNNNNNNGNAQAAPQSDVQKAFQELQTTLENKDASAADIKAKLKALREAREKAKQELAKARESLRELLTARQEAELVLMGMLD